MPNPLNVSPEPKASRVRVFQAADQILRSGRRPTVEAIRELLGGGSPNSVTAYIQDWYQELGERLNTTEKPLAGFPKEAISLLSEMWRIAATDRTGNQMAVADDADRRLLEAERDSLLAQNKALEVLNQELQRHRASAERSLAEARALLSRREGALESAREQMAKLQQALAASRMQLEVTLALQRATVAPSVAGSTARRERKRAVRIPRTRVSAKSRKNRTSEYKRAPTKTATILNTKAPARRKFSSTTRRTLGKAPKRKRRNS